MRQPSYFETVSASYDEYGDDSNWDWDYGDEAEWTEEDEAGLEEWTDEDEAALEKWEEERRAKLAEANEY